MDTGLIILTVGVLVVVFLIFKFIKKIISAVLSVAMLLVVIIAVAGGLAYYDYNNLVGQKDYDIKVVYAQEDDFFYGIQLPIRGGLLDEENITGLSSSDVKAIDVDEVKSGDGYFVLAVQKDLYNELLDSQDIYDLSLLINWDLTYTLELTPDEIKQVMVSNDAEEELVNIILDKNDLSGSLRAVAKPLAQRAIRDLGAEYNLEVEQMLFAAVFMINLQEETNIVKVAEGFKDNKLQIYPERFTFKLLKFVVPVKTIKGILGADSKDEDSE